MWLSSIGESAGGTKEGPLFTATNTGGQEETSWGAHFSANSEKWGTYSATGPCKCSTFINILF